MTGGALSAAGLRRALRIFLVGRALSGLLGVAWLALLVKALPTPALGAYFAMGAVFEITQLASGLGVLGYVQRFLPVDMQQAGRRALARQLLALLAWRALTLAAAALMLAALWPMLPAWASRVPPFLFLAWLMGEGLVRLIEPMLESLLLQGQRQALALLRNAMRLAGLGAGLAAGVGTTLPGLIALEAGVSAGLALLGLLLLARRLRAQPPAGTAPAPALRPRLVFAWQGHLALLLGLVAGVDTIKLLLGATAGPAALAAFGLAVAMVEMAARHLPAQLLFDYARAVLTARSGPPRPAHEAWFWPRLLVRVNALALIALLAWMLACGDAARRVFSAGLPPPGLLPCLGLLLAMLFVQAFRLMAGLVAHLGTDNRSVLWATLATWCAPPVVLLAAPRLGALAGALGLVLVELSHALVLKQRLRLRLADLLGEPRLWRQAGAAGVLAAACGGAAAAWGEPRVALVGGTLVLAGIYALLLWRLRPLLAVEAQALLRLAGRAQAPAQPTPRPALGPPGSPA